MRDLIFISLEDWDDVWRRNQHICSRMLRRFPGMRLLFVERSRDVSHALRRLDPSSLGGAALRELPEWPGLTLFRPLKWLPNSLFPCRQINSLHLRNQVRAAARAARLKSPVLWINDHFAQALAGRLGEKGVVYDITDDWSLMPSIPVSERARIRRADEALCAKADLVVVCSQALEHSRRPACRKLVCIPNGVDLTGYPEPEGCEPEKSGAAAVAKWPIREASEFQNRPPVLGYVGTLHPDRLDLDLLVALASGFPEARIVLCGPDLLGNPAKARLNALGNLQLRAPVPYSEVPRVLAEFDVNILPHRCTPFTESLNPIKLWEYMASGKPIAATPVAGFREYSRFCHLGQGGAGFVRACREALSEAPHLAQERRREALRHSWETRLEDLLVEFRNQGWLEPGSSGGGGQRVRLGRHGRRSRSALQGDFRVGGGHRTQAVGYRQTDDEIVRHDALQTPTVAGL